MSNVHSRCDGIALLPRYSQDSVQKWVTSQYQENASLRFSLDSSCKILRDYFSLNFFYQHAEYKSMKIKYLITLLVVSSMILPMAFAQRKISAQQQDGKNSVRPTFQQVSHIPEVPEQFKEESVSKVWEVASLPNPWVIHDSNDDGKADYALVMYDSNFAKSREGIDNNYDGYLDDFAYFDDKGNIVYQEIDSNYDRQIDIWVEIDKGERVSRIQRDLNYDGIVDRDLQ